MNSRPLEANTALLPHQLAQVPVLGVALDGQALPFAERLEAEFFDPALTDVVDDEGVVRYEVWTASDAGGVFVAGTTTLIAPISQGGFCAPNLAAWADLALATPLDGSPTSAVSWAVNPEGGPVLIAIDDSVRSLAGLPRFELGPAWPAVIEALRPFDRAGALRGFLLASGGERRDGLKGGYGPAVCFSARRLVELASAFAEVPADAVRRLEAPLAALARYEITTGEGIDASWIEGQLERTRKLVADAVATQRGVAVVIA